MDRITDLRLPEYVECVDLVIASTAYRSFTFVIGSSDER